MSVGVGLDVDAIELGVWAIAFSIPRGSGFELCDEPATLGSSPFEVDVTASAAGADDQVMSRNANGSGSVSFEPLSGIELFIEQGSPKAQRPGARLQPETDVVGTGSRNGAAAVLRGLGQGSEN
ncbi:hypothetical protein AB4142_05910 [Variovorax sp. 2RAF20]|uniref:hypothetical protein n=1 Tax=Variovorax sp. CF313 TaxID=1144315 RepID=UPI0002710254|nr:hypothetical protein [Variovorax sp. CF313]EJL76615.1 hypothetical protein PMI12_02378 [Variovorax sp. CF313]